jgi:hypothetical protein
MVGVILCSKARRLQRGQQAVDIGDQDIGAARELHVEAGVEHIRRGHALMHEARFGADDLGQMGQEGDDVMLGLALDLVDALHIEGRVLGLGPDRLRRILRNGAQFRQRVGGMRLDLEPDLEAGLRLPDGGHFRTGIARDHVLLLAPVINGRVERAFRDLFGPCPFRAAAWRPRCSGRPDLRSRASVPSRARPVSPAGRNAGG